MIDDKFIIHDATIENLDCEYLYVDVTRYMYTRKTSRMTYTEKIYQE